MATYNKEKFQEYLMTKVTESTAKIYATDMAVCVKALEKIKLYEGKELEEILEDFISHKKAVKNYLQDEFLTALTEIGSNDSGLYDGILSKAKHYLAMHRDDSSNDKEIVAIKLMTYEELEGGEEDEVSAEDWIEYEVDSKRIDEYIAGEERLDYLFPDDLSQKILNYYGRIKNDFYTMVRVEYIKFRDEELDVYEVDEEAFYESATSYHWLQTEFQSEENHI